MSYLERLEKNICTCTESDHHDIAHFFDSQHQADRTVLSFKRWKWMFVDNPNISRPTVWVYKKSDRILAHQASIPFVLKAGNEYYPAAWGVKVMVAEEHQKKGIGYALTQKWTADTHVPVALHVLNGAYRMYRKAGWVDLGRMVCFVKLLDVEYIVRRYLPVPTAARIISKIVNLPLRLRDHVRSSRRIGEHISAQRIDRFDQAVDELWKRASGDYEVIARRDSTYLNWKYASDPDIPYTLFQFIHADRAIGYAVLAINKAKDRVPTGYIVDFLAESQHITSVIDQIINHFRTQKLSRVYLCILCKDLEASLRKMGFHRRGEESRMMVKLQNKAPDILTDPGKWFVTLGESDLPDGEMIASKKTDTPYALYHNEA